MSDIEIEEIYSEILKYIEQRKSLNQGDIDFLEKQKNELEQAYDSVQGSYDDYDEENNGLLSGEDEILSDYSNTLSRLEDVIEQITNGEITSLEDLEGYFN